MKPTMQLSRDFEFGLTAKLEQDCAWDGGLFEENLDSFRPEAKSYFTSNMLFEKMGHTDLEAFEAEPIYPQADAPVFEFPQNDGLNTKAAVDGSSSNVYENEDGFKVPEQSQAKNEPGLHQVSQFDNEIDLGNDELDLFMMPKIDPAKPMTQMCLGKKLFGKDNWEREIEDESTGLSPHQPLEICSPQKVIGLDHQFENMTSKTSSNAKTDIFTQDAGILKLGTDLVMKTPEPEATVIPPQKSAAPQPTFTSQTVDAVKPTGKKGKKSTALRKDVVNKTVIRSLKRYYTQVFEEFTPDSQNADCDKITEFVQQQLASSLANLQTSEVTLNDVVFVMKVLLQPDLVKKMSKTRSERFLMNNYYDCIYKYSHKRLLKLSQQKSTETAAFRFVFTEFVQSGKFEELVMSDATLQRTPEAYLTAANTLLTLFTF
mmetsp:Transcript_15050/g.21056  ORF Transcript_15050/g.21056 Transcript_15050/m.21056 type:complete len:430 (+) Transcript_15050:1-1290(+)